MTPERYDQIGYLLDEALKRAPSDRAAFLAEACGDNELRREVTSLIASHEQADKFIEQPPDDIAAGWQAAVTSIPQTSFAHYRVLSLLGKGGMGEVWLAEDSQLGRKVAIKLLTSDITIDEGRVRRFSQEARAASSLNHPNIITIYEIGETAADSESRHYIVTEYVKGETLRQRMSRAPNQQMRLEEAVDVATQIAAALAAAHEAGIVHRDIKPDNVMVRRDQIVKVLDFGLAKLTEPLTPSVGTQAASPAITTETGMVMGTPRYMSPEQARAEKVDSRTDIFSVGVLLYEMVTGSLPFTGTTTSDVIAAILRDEPAPLANHLSHVPAELDKIISTALRKDRVQRYQTARDLLVDLRDFQHQINSRTRIGRRTTQRGRKITATIAAAVLSFVAIIAWFYFNRHAALTETDTILLADFENKTGEEIFDGMLKQALAIQLQQSPFLNLFPEAQVRQTLTLMGRSPNERVTTQIAGEICVRDNLKALIAGVIAPLGSHYVISLESIDGQSGESLAREQVEAESREQVLRAVSQAASQLREKLGESLRSIKRYDKPLTQATTSKLEAFKAWSLGIESSYRGRLTDAILFYRRAIDLDPEFAHAYSVLSTVYGNSGQPALAAEYAEKGYLFKDKVSEYEKLRITNFYYGFATGNLSKRIDVLTLLNSTYPRDCGGPTDLALTYRQVGKYDQAVAEATRAIHLNPNFAPAYRSLVFALLHLNRFVEVKDILAQARQHGLDTTDFHGVLYQIALADGDLDAMNDQINSVAGKPDEYVASDWQAGTAAFAGRWRKSQESANRAIDLTTRGETMEVAARYAVEQSLRGAIFGDQRRAKEYAAQGLRLARGRASLPRAALALALCGDSNQAKAIVDELIRIYPEDTVINSIWVPTIRAAIQMKRGNVSQMIEQLQPASSYEGAAEFWPQYLRGTAYLTLKRGVEAAGEFKKILDNRGQATLSPLYPLAYLGLARSWDVAREMPKSLEARNEFFAVWKDADPDLPVLIQAKREFAAK